MRIAARLSCRNTDRRACEAEALEEEADKTFAAGSSGGETGDNYVGTTVFLAMVLFLLGISTHFPLDHADRLGRAPDAAGWSARVSSLCDTLPDSCDRAATS